MNITQNDYGFDLSFSITDANGVVDLTDATVVFKMVNENTSSAALEKTCVSSVPTSGVCSITTASTDFSTVGNYLWQLQSRWSNKTVTYKCAATDGIRVLEEY